ncbi:MAG: hypothetical protein ACYTEL_20950 [Planctomycetota bacterium]|jgi:uncharacterized membrane protein
MRRDLIIPGIVAPLAAVLTAELIVVVTCVFVHIPNPAFIPVLLAGLPTVGLVVTYVYTFCITIPVVTRDSECDNVNHLKLYLAAIGFSAIFLVVMGLGGIAGLGLGLFYGVWILLPSSLVAALTFHLVRRFVTRTMSPHQSDRQA